MVCCAIRLALEAKAWRTHREQACRPELDFPTCSVSDDEVQHHQWLEKTQTIRCAVDRGGKLHWCSAREFCFTHVDDCAARELEGVFVGVSSRSEELLMMVNFGIVSGVSCPVAPIDFFPTATWTDWLGAFWDVTPEEKCDKKQFAEAHSGGHASSVSKVLALAVRELAPIRLCILKKDVMTSTPTLSCLECESAVAGFFGPVHWEQAANPAGCDSWKSSARLRKAAEWSTRVIHGEMHGPLAAVTTGASSSLKSSTVPTREWAASSDELEHPAKQGTAVLHRRTPAWRQRWGHRTQIECLQQFNPHRTWWFWHGSRQQSQTTSRHRRWRCSWNLALRSRVQEVNTRRGEVSSQSCNRIHRIVVLWRTLIVASHMWLLPNISWRVNCVFNLAMIRELAPCRPVFLRLFLCLRVLTQCDHCAVYWCASDRVVHSCLSQHKAVRSWWRSFGDDTWWAALSLVATSTDPSRWRACMFVGKVGCWAPFACSSYLCWCQLCSHPWNGSLERPPKVPHPTFHLGVLFQAVLWWKIKHTWQRGQLHAVDSLTSTGAVLGSLQRTRLVYSVQIFVLCGISNNCVKLQLRSAEYQGCLKFIRYFLCLTSVHCVRRLCIHRRSQQLEACVQHCIASVERQHWGCWRPLETVTQQWHARTTLKNGCCICQPKNAFVLLSLVAGDGLVQHACRNQHIWRHLELLHCLGTLCAPLGPDATTCGSLPSLRSSSFVLASSKWIRRSNIRGDNGLESRVATLCAESGNAAVSSNPPSTPSSQTVLLSKPCMWIAAQTAIFEWGWGHAWSCASASVLRMFSEGQC